MCRARLTGPGSIHDAANFECPERGWRERLAPPSEGHPPASTRSRRPAWPRRPLFLQERVDRFEELESRFLEENEVRRILDESALLHGGVREIPHQPLSIGRVGPGIELAGDEDHRDIDGRGTPERTSRRLEETVLQNPVWRAQARWVAGSTGWVGRQCRGVEGVHHALIAILRLVGHRDLAVPARLVCRAGRQAIRALRLVVVLPGAALVLKRGSCAEVGVLWIVTERRV